jgi:DNA-binding LacI/PurR family transcriptional regulator
LLDGTPKPTAVFCDDDVLAAGLYVAARERGLRVPDDLSVVSMVTSPQVAELATPALTAMTSPGSTMVRLAVKALLDVLDGDGADRPPIQRLVPCALEVRGSSGPARRTSLKDPHHPSVARRRAATRRRA